MCKRAASRFVSSVRYSVVAGRPFVVIVIFFLSTGCRPMGPFHLPQAGWGARAQSAM